MHNHETHVPVVLNMPDDFTGRILVYLDKGRVKPQRRLKNSETVDSPELFSELYIRTEIKPELLAEK